MPAAERLTWHGWPPALADGALHGARGNSGVILSQILRGLADVAAEATAERGGELSDVDGAVLAAALRHAVGLAVASMGESVPGTIVSVLQAGGRSGRRRRRRGHRPRRGGRPPRQTRR